MKIEGDPLQEEEEVVFIRDVTNEDQPNTHQAVLFVI